MLRQQLQEVADQLERSADHAVRLFRPKPPSDIAQALLDLMRDEREWTRGFLAVNHERAGVRIACNGFAVVVTAGRARLTLEGRDRDVVESAYRKLKRRLADRRKAEAADQMRQALQVKIQPPALPPPAAEPLEVLEARVRRLREAMRAMNA